MASAPLSAAHHVRRGQFRAAHFEQLASFALLLARRFASFALLLASTMRASRWSAPRSGEGGCTALAAALDFRIRSEGRCEGGSEGGRGFVTRFPPSLYISSSPSVRKSSAREAEMRISSSCRSLSRFIASFCCSRSLFAEADARRRPPPGMRSPVVVASVGRGLFQSVQFTRQLSLNFVPTTFYYMLNCDPAHTGV